MTRIRLPVFLLVSALLVVACRSSDDAPQPTGTAGGQTSPADSGSAPDGSPAGSSPSVASPEPSPTTVTATAAVGTTERHPANVEVTVTRVVVEDRAIYVAIEAINGAGREIQLASNREFVALEDDTGNVYAFQPPEDNPTLTLQVSEELTGRLAFVGPLAPDVGQLRLGLNYNPQTDRAVDLDNPNATSPSFIFEDLPAPGT